MTSRAAAKQFVDSEGPASAEAARPSSGCRLLLVASDRRFRAVASALLTQRGYVVIIGDARANVTELAAREGAELVLLDASGSLTQAAADAARLATLRPAVPMVAVSAEPQRELAALPVISKWSSFDRLLAAIEHAQPSARTVPR
jgi:DNA-binding NtrC family response regulator